MPMLQLSHGQAAPASSDLLTAIEHSFLQRRFEEALKLSFSALLEVSEDRDYKNKGKTKELFSNLRVENVTSEIAKLQHRCTHPECKCVLIMSILVQILFEMERSQDVLPCVTNFYGDLMQTPYDVFFICINLLVNTLNDINSAKRILRTVLDSKLAQRESVPEYKYELTEEQREVLLEFFIFHVMVPCEELKEAMAYLEFDNSLPSWKKQGWMDYLKKLDEQQHAPPQENNNTNTPTKSLDLRADTPTSWVKQATKLFLGSKNMASYWVLALRKQYNSRLGLLACSLAVAITTILYLLNSWRSSKLLTDGAQALQSRGTKKSWFSQKFAGVGALLADAFKVM